YLLCRSSSRPYPCIPILRTRRPQRSTLFPYTTLFRSRACSRGSRATTSTRARCRRTTSTSPGAVRTPPAPVSPASVPTDRTSSRSEEHTSELQSRENLVCRLLLEKKKKTTHETITYG